MINEIKIFWLAILTIYTISYSELAHIQTEKNDIYGTWVSTDDTSWKWVFTSDGKCYDYYNNIQTDIYLFSIETSSPQCGETVPTGDLFSYISLKNIKNNSDQNCYEILSMNESSLQLRWLKRGGSITFKKK